MRLSLVPPDELPSEARPLYDDIASVVAKKLNGFVSSRGDGALVGPFNIMLHYPEFGQSAWAFTKAMIEEAQLPKPVREVAILVVGARFTSRYEIYAHEHVAERSGLSKSKIATISAGERPVDLTAEEGAAYDVASALVNGKQVPRTTYEVALETFGDMGIAELVYLVSCYCMISMLLNGFDVSVPGSDHTFN